MINLWVGGAELSMAASSHTPRKAASLLRVCECVCPSV